MSKFSRVLVFLAGSFLLSAAAFSFEWPGFLIHQINGVGGFSVAGKGDVDGDGKADFIIGNPFAGPSGMDGAGTAYVYSGTTGNLLYQKDGSATGDKFGYSVAIVGDIDLDGKTDFIIGAPNTAVDGRTQAGSAFIYSGATGTLLYRKDGAELGDVLGNAVAGAGDVNGDGRLDFILGAYWADPGGISEAGSVYVYSGADGSLLFQKDGAI